MNKTEYLEGAFVFEPGTTEPLGSALYDEHLKLTEKSRLAEFAGYLMPLWYSSISAEHTAVRTAAGIFDCTHMGALEVSGADAPAFLNLVTTNNIEKIQPGAAQYSYISDAAGNILDDIIIYQRSQNNFMVVVNAANEPKIKAYLAALLTGRAILDADNQNRRLEYKPDIRDMRDTTTGPDCRVDIALQGPQSINILTKINSRLTEPLQNLKSFHFIEAQLDGIDCIISRTGYTGAKVSFELFLHHDQAPQLWQRLLSAGAVPCGLGARDSLRIEAGLPLYGHELAGEFNISPFQAGYGWAVKLDKDFFIGKSAMQQAANSCDMNVARIELPGAKGIRPVRQNDGVVDTDGICVGWVLSSAKAGEKQIALVYADKNQSHEKKEVGIYYLARSESQKSKGKKQNVDRGEKLEADITGRVVSRFEKF